MRKKKFPNNCELLSLDDLDYNKIASESLKKDLVDWCKADRKEWIDKPLNHVYAALYLPTREKIFSSLSDEEKNDYIEKKKAFGISMDAIKTNAMLRYAIERAKFYGSKEKFIETHGEYAFKRFFIKESGSKLDTRWETIEELIKKGFS